MRTSARNLLCVGTALASLAAGVVGARAVSGSDKPAPLAFGLTDPPVLIQGDIAQADDQVYPLLAPAAIGDDPRIIDRLLEGPAEIADYTSGPAGVVGPGVGPAGEDAPATGAVIGPPVGDAPADEATPIDGTVPPDDSPPSGDDSPSPSDLPLVFDPMVGSTFRYPELAFDLCAGLAPGTPPPSYCPAGYAGTLSALHMAPEPFMYGVEGHYTTVTPDGFPQVCPASTPAAGAGQVAITTWSVTPLNWLVVEWRPYRSTEEWRSLLVEPATDATQEARWLARLETEAFDRTTWGLVPRCVVIDRDPDLWYEVRFTATDVFGRDVPANPLTLVGNDPASRPPTEAIVSGVRPFADVQSWTTREGSVTFTSKVLTDPEDRECGLELTSEDGVHTTDVAAPIGGFGTTRFTRQVITTVPLPEAGVVLLCATIFDSRNTLRPLAVDKLLLQAKTAQRPVITLEGIRLAGRITIGPDRLGVVIQAPDEPIRNGGCDHRWRNTELLSGSVTVQAPLWECAEVPLPTGISGYLTVPITVSRRVDPTTTTSENRIVVWGIAIQVDRCGNAECPLRPTEWYEIPLPPAGETLCGGSFGAGGSCPQPDEGVAIIKVTYPIVQGAPGRDGSATLVSTSDRPMVDPTEGEPLFENFEQTLGTSDDWGALPLTVVLGSDRAVTLTSIDYTGRADTDPECMLRDVPVGGAPATEWTIDLTICASTMMTGYAHFIDANGVAYSAYIGYVAPPEIVSEGVHTKIEFLGGDAPAFGIIYPLSGHLEDQSAAMRNVWRSNAPGRAPSERFIFRGASDCLPLDNGSIENMNEPGWEPDPFVMISGGGLDVTISLTIVATGETECAAVNWATDTPSGTTIELVGSFTASQLSSGEPWVLTTPPGAALQVRITLTGEFRLVARF